MAAGRRSGQASAEWVALVALVAIALGALLWATGPMRATTALPATIAERLLCAVRLTSSCGSEPAVTAVHGPEIARLLRTHAPTILYEEGMRALPVDYRRCRRDACAEGATSGSVARSEEGEPVVAFVHAIDCRSRSAAASERAGADCSGPRRGNLYLQYWFYYPGSATGEGSTPLRRPIRRASTVVGIPTYHPDDWESLQLRIAPDGSRSARASSHKRYRYEIGGLTLIPGHRVYRDGEGEIQVERRSPAVNGWGPDVGTLYVAGGSHAGNARINRVVSRRTRARRLRLVPLLGIAQRDETAFAVTPPWRKRVFFDPENPGTD